MFYDRQPAERRNEYRQLLTCVGSISNIFSENEAPYLYYRAHENIFCKSFGVRNLARKDCSVDAVMDCVGIGLKTWIGNSYQKIAEFDKNSPIFKELKGKKLIKQVSEFRNKRLSVTKNTYGLDSLLYHVVHRTKGMMHIYESTIDEIDVNSLSVIKTRGNITHFTDGRHKYEYNASKSTLLMKFENMELMDEFDVEILPDPYEMLLRMCGKENNVVTELLSEDSPKEQVCLRLYSSYANGKKYIAEHSGLNQWNGARLDTRTGVRRQRHPNELYIPYPAVDRRRNRQFFPDRNTQFNLTLPDGTVISAKVCQDDDKAIMSNPNKVLGEWLLRKVFEVPEGTLITYEMLQRFGIDSVIFTKNRDLDYSIDFAQIGTYEKFYGLEDDE